MRVYQQVLDLGGAAPEQLELVLGCTVDEALFSCCRAASSAPARPEARRRLPPLNATARVRREALRALKRHFARVEFRLLRGQQPADRADRVVKVRGGKVRIRALA